MFLRTVLRTSLLPLDSSEQTKNTNVDLTERIMLEAEYIEKLFVRISIYPSTSPRRMYVLNANNTTTLLMQKSLSYCLDTLNILSGKKRPDHKRWQTKQGPRLTIRGGRKTRKRSHDLMEIIDD